MWLLSKRTSPSGRSGIALGERGMEDTTVSSDDYSFVELATSMTVTRLIDVHGDRYVQSMQERDVPDV
jgi:hypothetical protein